MITAPQINIMTNASNNPLSVPPWQSEGTSTGGFMNVLAAMMADGGNQGGDMPLMFKSPNMLINDMLQGLVNGSVDELDPLLLSLIQQLLAAPQQMQDLMNGFVTAADNMVQQLAQYNYGQFKDLAEFVNAFANNTQSNQPMTLEEIKAAIMNKFGQSMAVSADALRGDSQSLKQVDMTTIQRPIELINNDNPKIQEPVVQSQGPEVQQAVQDLKALGGPIAERGTISLIDDKKAGQHMTLLNGKTPEQHPKLLNDKVSDLNLSELIDDLGPTKGVDLSEVETKTASTSLFNAEKDRVLLNTQRAEPQAVTVGSQTVLPKNEQSLKETLHVSRLQEIDSKIIKAIEAGQNSLTLRLEPPELGSVKIRLVLTDGMVRADIRVENAAVKDMMNLAMPQIRNSLENAGIKVSEFFVDIREEYYSDGKRQNQDSDAHKQHRHKKEKGEDFKPFDFFI
jgi:flagellar hook-length control protein FliK